MILFPFTNYWWFYAGFTALILVIILLDLGIFHRKAHEVSFKEAAFWSTIWLGFALCFCVVLYFYSIWDFTHSPFGRDAPIPDPSKLAKQIALEFLTGYIIEESLSVDNLFVFLVIFNFFRIPSLYQHRVLFYGILGALVFRGIFISLGAILIEFKLVVYLFGAFLILTGIKIILTTEKELSLEDHVFLKILRRILPVTPNFDGQKLLVRINGKTFVTPLLVCLIFVEISDVVFAVDSVPAIFAITREPMVVFTSNVCAILGLRSMYFLLASVVERFRFLRYGLGLVLMFVGAKMVYLDHLYDGKFPIGYSLVVICCLVGGSIAFSFLVPEKDKQDSN